MSRMSSSAGKLFEEQLKASRDYLKGKIPSVILMATSSKATPIKREHLDYLIEVTNKRNELIIGNLLRHLVMQANKPHWCVALKSILTINHLMHHGSYRFFRLVISMAAAMGKQSKHYLCCNKVDLFTVPSINGGRFLRHYYQYLKVKLTAHQAIVGLSVRFEQHQKAFKLMGARSGNNFMQPIEVSEKKITFAKVHLVMRQMEQICQVDYVLSMVAILGRLFDQLPHLDYLKLADLSNRLMRDAFEGLCMELVEFYLAYEEAMEHLIGWLYSAMKGADLKITWLIMFKEFLRLRAKFFAIMQFASHKANIKKLPNIITGPNVFRISFLLDQQAKSTGPNRRCVDGLLFWRPK